MLEKVRLAAKLPATGLRAESLAICLAAIVYGG